MEQLNSIVDFETAKLLKEKGFDDDDCQNIYYCDFEEGFEPDELQVSDRMLKEPEVGEFDYLAPKISIVIDWIYNKHGIWINVEVSSFNTNTLTNERRIFLDYTIYSPKENIFIHEEDKDKIFNSPKEAYIEAIKYVLTKMI